MVEKGQLFPASQQPANLRKGQGPSLQHTMLMNWLSHLLTTMTMTSYGTLTQAVNAKNGSLQGSITAFLSERTVFLWKMYNFRTASHEAVREGETTTHRADCLETC